MAGASASHTSVTGTSAERKEITIKHSPTAFLLAIILTLLPIAPSPQAQEQSPPRERAGGGTIIPPGQLQIELPLRRANAATVINPQTEAPSHLPMTILIMDRSDGTGGLTIERQ